MEDDAALPPGYLRVVIVPARQGVSTLFRSGASRSATFEPIS